MAWHEFFNALRYKRYYSRLMPILYIGFLFDFFWGLTVPIYSIRINEITQSLVMSGFVLGLWGIIRFLSDIPTGFLCDRVGTKKIIKISLLAYLFIAFFYTVVNDTFYLIILRIIHSFFGSFFLVSLWSIIRGVPKRYMEEEVEMFTTLGNIALIISPLVGSFLIMIYSWKAPFYLLSASFLAMLLITKKIPEKNNNEKIAKKDYIKDLRINWKVFLGVFLAIIFYGSAMSLLGSFLPIIMQNEGFTIAEIGLVFSIASSIPWIIMPLLTLEFIEKKGVVCSIVLGALISANGFFFFQFNQNIFAILILIFIINVGMSMVMPGTNIVIGKIARDGEAGRFTGIIEIFKDMSFFVGSFGGGLLLSSFGLESFGLLSIVLILPLLPIYFLLKQ